MHFYGLQNLAANWPGVSIILGATALLALVFCLVPSLGEQQPEVRPVQEIDRGYLLELNRITELISVVQRTHTMIFEWAGRDDDDSLRAPNQAIYQTFRDSLIDVRNQILINMAKKLDSLEQQ